MPRLAPVCLLVAFALVACEPAATPAPDSPQPRPQPNTKIPPALLTTLHHAAEEMALDGFQSDNPELGWPADVGAKDSHAYISLLVEKKYLTPESAEAASRVTVANAAETDPLETALFKTIAKDGSVTVVRKDGTIETSSENSPPPPPRDPAWLP